MDADDNLLKDLAACLTNVSNLIAPEQRADNFYGELKRLNLKNLERKLLIAFSGGPDSTVALLALQETAPSFGFTLYACHINHRLRAEESDADADFCRQICQELNLDCQIIKLSLPASETHFSEDTLRHMRYQSLADYAKAQNITFIATGHTLDDQSETILFNLFRGTGLTGLTGMKTGRQLSESTYILRPLLGVTKSQCKDFLNNKNIVARNDSSNNNEIYMRNYVRHKIMPSINQRFPDFRKHLYSMRQILASEDELLDELALQLADKLNSPNPDNWSLALLKQQPFALQRRAIGAALQKRNIELSYERIEQILALSQSNQTLNLNQYWRVRSSKNQLLWQKILPKNESIEFAPITVKVPGISNVLPLGIALSVEVYREGDPQQSLVNLANIKPPLMLRLRQPGDIIRPLGMGQIVKLKKYLHTHKKTSTDYTETEILLADQEEVLWVPARGGISEKIKVTDEPSHSLQWLKLPDYCPTIL